MKRSCPFSVEILPVFEHIELILHIVILHPSRITCVFMVNKLPQGSPIAARNIPTRVFGITRLWSSVEPRRVQNIKS